MDINIYINQKKINPLHKKGIDEYIKRLTPYCRLSLICTSENPSLSCSRDTADIVLTGVDGGRINSTGTDAGGSSGKFAEQINRLTSAGVSHINFYIGYKDDANCGMARLCLCTLSVSADMEALMLSEQVYRAFTILNHITYHK